MASSSLYPPIIAYSMPAFAVDTTNEESTSVRVYFALSAYNKRSNITEAHVTVRFQQNNANALKSEYKTQFKVCNIYEVSSQEDATIASTPSKYYILIESKDLENGFQPDVTYKVQIRFSDITSTSDAGISWYNSNLSHFSEWSTVCLIRGIIKPDFYVVGLNDNAGEYESDEVELMLASVDSDFLIAFIPGSKTETLYRWRVQLLDVNKVLLSDSDWTIFDSYNNILTESNGSVSFEAILPYQMEDEKYYFLYITIETKNGYVETKKIPFQVTAYSTSIIHGTIDAHIIEENGYAEIKATSNGENIIQNITLRRSSSKSNFTIWEDIANVTILNEPLDWKYYDFTIESGVWYRYGIQTRDNRGRRGVLLLSNITMGEFEDAFLLEGGTSLTSAKQLKLKYNFNISNFVRTIAESKTDTIGSQFPYVRRNGNMYYREIQCSGLITAYMDAYTNLFTSDKELYNNNETRYREVRDQIEYRYNQYDYTYEKEFRKAVEAFLYNGKVKLFKSLQEGNIIVKVMNVSLTPKQELGRLLYDFTATLVEVDEATVANLDTYGFLNIGTYNTNITFESGPLIGHYASETIKGGTIIMDLIKEKYNIGKSLDGKIAREYYLSYLKIEIESPPYLIFSDGANKDNTPKPIDDIYDQDSWDASNDALTTKEQLLRDNVVLGWLFEIDGVTILIEPPNNIYELKGDNVHISGSSSIKPIKDTKLQIDMITYISYEEDTSKVATKIIHRKINGQYINNFDTSENIIRTLWYRYYVDYYSEEADDNADEIFYTQLISILSVDIDAEPGTIIKARSSAVKSELTKFIVGETGILSLDPGSEEFIISELYVVGKRLDVRYLSPKYNLIPMQDRDITPGVRDYGDMFVTEYDNTTLKRFNDVHNRGNSKPTNSIKLYDYYIEDGQAYMYYNDNWYPTTIQQIEGHNTIFEIECPMDAMVFFFAVVEKGIY